MKREVLYSSEADLCKAFIAWATPQGWTAYPETAGWDIILVNSSGHQIGVQAKLRFNATLLRQVLPSEFHADEGPDHRAVLLPIDHIEQDIRSVFEFCGIDNFRPNSFGPPGRFAPSIEFAELVDWCPSKRCKLPDYVPDSVAGSSCPVTLTEWKIKALRVVATLELKGSITCKEIRSIGCDPRRWVHPYTGWLQPKHLKHGEYVRGEKLNFDKQHPEVYPKIRAEIEKQLATVKGAG